MELRPDYVIALSYRAVGRVFRGDVEQGVSGLRSAMKTIGPNPAMLGSTGLGLGFMGRHAEAHPVLAALEAAGRERYVAPVSRAWVCLGPGGRRRSSGWTASSRPAIRTFRTYQLLRQDAPFTALLRKMRLG